jgi:hypothetical protein
LGRPTRIFDKLPSDAGVTFEGFEDIRIKSRESVKAKLEDFMKYCKDTKKPAIRVILGEWGEGKTDAYKRYIQPKCQTEGNYAFFVSASTLSNCFDLPQIKRLFETTSISAIRFLVVLFNSVREESREIKIPNPENYRDAYAYLNDILTNLIGDKKTRKIFVFIDEFEELLLNPSKLKDIISGIKETINGRFTAIDDGGEYEGCVHLIVAATPDAFYRLQVDEETALIFGGLGRRAGVIELPRIRKQEGIEFLYALLKYSYGNNLPQPLPFDSLGVFHTLYRITQGNPGNLVSLFTRLMNSARIDHNQVKNIDSEHLLKFLEKEQVFVYGGTTRCLETETFFRILKIVEEQNIKETGQKCGTLLKILVSELKPFSVEELESRVGSRDIKNIISIINNELKSREGIERAILKVSPLQERKSFHDVIEAFKDYITIEGDKKYIKIDNYSELLEDFEDRITYFFIDGDKITSQIYLPSEKNSLMSFFEGISFERAIEIEHLVNRRLCKDEDYYITSDELLSQIFPTPVPRELEFIKNREFRMKLWREVTRNLAEQYENYMPEAFMYILEKSKLFKLVETEREAPKFLAKFAELIIDEIRINCLFYSINGDVKSQDIEELDHLIKSKRPPVHCVVLLYTGEITQEAEDKIINKELGKEGENVILDVHLHPTLAKRIISIYRASFNPEEIGSESLFMSVIKRIVIQELDFQDKVKDWLKAQEGRGIVITDLPIEATSSLREFADALKFYINFMGKEYTAQEIFNKNRDDLLKFIKYEAKKISIIPDIEFPKFTRLTEELVNNGFLLQSEGKYLLQPHPTEKRILSILKKETKLSNTELRAYFIIKSARFLEDVFLPILEYKGLVRCEGNNYSLTNANQLYTEVELEFQNFKRLTETKKYHDYGYVFMTKERGYRFITLKEFETFAENLHRQAQEMTGLNEEVALQKLSLLQRLLRHFVEEFLPLFNNAASKAEDILINVRSSHSKLKEELEQVRDECDKWLKLEFSVESISEYKSVKKKYDEIEKYIKYGHEEVTRIVNEKFVKNEDILKVFFFRKNDEEAFYFNPKLYLVSSQKAEFDKISTTIENVTRELNVHFQTLTKRQEQIEHEIRDMAIDAKNRISFSLLEILKQLVKNVFPELQPITYETISLSDINQYIQRNIYSINLNLNNLSNCVTFLKDVLESERSFLLTFEDNDKLRDHVLAVFDIKGYDRVAENFNSEMIKVKNEYEKNVKEITLQDAQTLLQKIKSLRPILEDLKKRIEDAKSPIDKAWSRYAKELNEYIGNIEYTLNLLEKYYEIDVEEITAELREIRETVNIKGVLDLKLKLSEIEQMKNQIHQNFYELVKNQKILEEMELKLLELVVKKIKQEGKVWLSDQELYQVARSELNIQPEKADKVLQKLIEQGLLKKGVSLSF